MSYQAYNGQVYGLYIESNDVLEVYDELLDLGAVFIDESFEDITIESAINDSTFDNEDKPLEDVCILPLGNWPTLLTQAYKSEDEIISELKEKYGKFLPQDYDYRNNVVCATYVVYS